MRANAIAYDCEIKKSILGSNEKPLPGVEYCAGWRDFKHMGVSCVGAYDFMTGQTRLFMDDNYDEFKKLIEERDVIISFNGDAFDGALVFETLGIVVPEAKSYDILAEMWEADGLGRAFSSSKNSGFGLDRTCDVNLGLRKSGHGALAPVLYQRGRFGELVDYCLNDIHMTRSLVELIVLQGGVIKHPKLNDGTKLTMRVPPGAWL